MSAVSEHDVIGLDLEVQRAIRAHEALEGTPIKVTADGDVVTLTGTADCYARRLTAEDVARHVPGVRKVVDQIEIPIDGIYGWRDVDLFDAAYRLLASHYLLARRRIEVEAHNGWLRLRGRVGSAFERVEAERAIASLPNLRGIRNDLVVG
jgi:osmotically-inducible protein OsmY